MPDIYGWEKLESELAEVIPLHKNEEEMDNMDMLARSNGLVGTGVTDNQNAGQFQGFSDSYFYVGYEDHKGKITI